MILEVSRTTYRIDKKLLERVAEAAFSFLKVSEDGFIELKFVSIDEITKLNMKYRNILDPTDVLSFNLGDNPVEGQVIICYNFVVEQANKLDKPFNHELSLLLVHGILHIYGYDHANTLEETKMQETERQILKMEGIKR